MPYARRRKEEKMDMPGDGRMRGRKGEEEKRLRPALGEVWTTACISRPCHAHHSICIVSQYYYHALPASHPIPHPAHLLPVPAMPFPPPSAL